MTATDHRFGIHYYQDLLGCLRRASRDEDAGDDAEFGTAFHHFAHLYHNGDLVEGGAQAFLSADRPLKKDGKAKTCSELELATRYAARFPPDLWGRKILAEERLFGTLQGEPIAGTLDWLGEFDQVAIDQLATVRNLHLPAPGRYLVDFKTKVQRGATLIDSYFRSPQFPLYHLLYEQSPLALGGPLLGTIVVILFRYLEARDDAFVTLLLPPPQAEDRLICETVILDGAARLRTLGPDHCTPIHCFDWNRPCPQLDLGCPRHNR